MLFNMSNEEKIKKLDSISYLYLLSGLICNGIWAIYAFNVNNYDIAVTSIFGKTIAFD